MVDAFKQRFGKANPQEATDIRFTGASYERQWQRTLGKLGSGWFLDGYLFLFGAGLQRLNACASAWSFLVPAGKERIVVGRNAYGALLIVEEPEDARTVYLLDPLRVVYWTCPGLDLLALIGRYLPRGDLPHFLEDEIYRHWQQTHGFVSEATMLAPITPLSLGGQMVLQNFQEEDMVSYYESTAPIYAKAFEKMKQTRRGRHE